MASNKKKKTNSKRIYAFIGCAVLLALIITLIVVGNILLNGSTTIFGSNLQPTETLPPNERQASDFSTQDGRVTYPGAVAGVDVSEHQGEIDWQAVHDSGISFAIIRLGYRGYSNGALCMDETFEQNISGAAAAGIKVGVYFFSQAVSEKEGCEEAEYVLNAIKNYEISCPVFFDWEEIQGAERTQGIGSREVTDAALGFCKRIEQDGYRAGVYFNQMYGYSLIRLLELKDYCFWLAEYDESMSFYYDVDYWQYSCSGTVEGIATNVDLNLMFDGE